MKRELSWNASWAWTGVRIPWPRPPHGQNDPRPAPSPCNKIFLNLKPVGISTWKVALAPLAWSKGMSHTEVLSHTYTSSCCISSEDSSQGRAQEDVYVCERLQWGSSLWTRRGKPATIQVEIPTMKICASVAFTKEYGSKSEVPKGPGIRLRSFMAVVLRCQNCPDSDTKDRVFLRIRSSSTYYKTKIMKIKNVDNF